MDFNHLACNDVYCRLISQSTGNYAVGMALLVCLQRQLLPTDLKQLKPI